VQRFGPDKFGYSELDSARETPEGGAYLKSKREAARYLGVSVALVEQLMRSGLAYVRLGKGNLVRFRPEDLAEYIEQRRVQHSGDPDRVTEVR
jgi:excisionase family DNA binding protein